jgi:hypothetical protein
VFEVKIIKVIHRENVIPEHKKQEELKLDEYSVSSFMEQCVTTENRELNIIFTKIPYTITKTKFDKEFSEPFENKKEGESVTGLSGAQKKKIIEVISEEFLRSLKPHQKSRSHNIEYLSLEEANERYPRTNNLSVGTYTLHPRDSSRLTLLEHYHRNLALEKDDELIVLLGRMGAKRVRIIERDDKQNLGGGHVSTDTILMEGQVGGELGHRISQEKELIVLFEGHSVDIEEDLLRNSLWFAKDSRLNAIFESRRFQSNKIEEYTLRNTYTETFDFDFDFAMSNLVFKVDLKTEYETISKKERLFHVEFGRSEMTSSTHRLKE